VTTVETELVHFREATPGREAEVARVMAECPDYYQAVQGRTAGPEEVHDFFHAEVPGIAPRDVRSYGIYSRGRMVGLASLVLGWKRAGQSMIGFLAVSERERGHGHARAACEALEAIARASPHGTSMRIGIVETNTAAFGFWHHLGFVETGERKTLAEFTGDVILLEKALDG